MRLKFSSRVMLVMSLFMGLSGAVPSHASASVFFVVPGVEAKELVEAKKFEESLPSSVGCATADSERKVELKLGDDDFAVFETSNDLLTDIRIAPPTPGTESVAGTFPVWSVAAKHSHFSYESAGQESFGSDILVKATRDASGVAPFFVGFRTVEKFTLNTQEVAPPGEPVATIELDYEAIGFPRVTVNRLGAVNEEVADLFLSDTGGLLENDSIPLTENGDYEIVVSALAFQIVDPRQNSPRADLNLRVKCNVGLPSGVGPSFEVDAPYKTCQATPDGGEDRRVTVELDKHEPVGVRSDVRFVVGDELVDSGFLEMGAALSLTIPLPVNADPDPDAKQTLRVFQKVDGSPESYWVTWFEDQDFHPGNCQGTIRDVLPPNARVGDIFGSELGDHTFGTVVEDDEPSAAYSYSVTNAPPGLQIDPHTGDFLGTTTEEGEWQTTVFAKRRYPEEVLVRTFRFAVAEPSSSYSMTGRVEFAADSSAASGLELTLSEWGSEAELASTTVGEDGSYVFADLTDGGCYMVRAMALDGYTFNYTHITSTAWLGRCVNHAKTILPTWRLYEISE